MKWILILLVGFSPSLIAQNVAVFGAGCFWCVEAVFEELDGVIKVESGYAGGHVSNPSYKAVCSGTTGHAEVAKIYYDSTIVSFEKLLEVFFLTHDPTTLNRQGADRGSQYRSVIFYLNDYQKLVSNKIKKSINDQKAYPDPVVTEITAFTNYYKAENYHQNYYKYNAEAGYCKYVIEPKLKKFRKAFAPYLK